MEIQMKEFVENNFSIFAAMTIQNRAICDVRDMVKPSQRLCMYAQLLDKITYKKPFKKSNKSVAACLDFGYVHGDSSCYDLLARMAKTFCFNYPLEEFEGQYTIQDGDAHSAPRYTSLRLGELGELLFDGVKENAIESWLDNYDNTDKYPTVLPSLGYYNICNGTMGLAVSISSSIPQFNLREVNEAMIKLLWNPNIDFEEIYCAPDFCTGGTILNSDKVKEFLKNGCGGAIILRSNVTYDEKENCLYVTELPYSVYSNRIIEQIKDGIENGTLIGIKHILDLSKKEANIKIQLEKNSNVNRIVRSLYKETSIQEAYTINMTMLDNGTRPKVFGWKEALQAHIDHEIICYKRIYNFRIEKINARINIIDGILKIYNNLEETIQIIKNSKDKNEAKSNLIKRFDLNAAQVEAILKITLAKLSHLEIDDYKKEKEKLVEEKSLYELYLSNKDELYKQIEKKMKEVAKKFGSNRKTKCINLDYKGEEKDAEPIEKKELLIHYTNLGNIYTQESTTLVKTKRGGKGSKIKLSDNEVIVKTINDDNFSSLLLFSNKGKMYSISIDELPINAKVNINQLFEFETDEHPTAITSISRNQSVKYYVFITKNGYIKKTSAEEYILKRGKSIKAINLKDNDEVVNVLFMSEEKVGILTFNGNYVIIDTESVRAIGRATAGVQAIKLSENDYVIDAKIIKDNDKYLITLSEKGLIKKASIEEFPLCSRGIKGKKISDIRESDHIVKFLTLDKDCDIIIIVKRKSIKISTSELRVLSRSATGVKAVEIADNDTASDLIRSQDE